MKKTLAVLLCIVMALTFMPMPSWAGPTIQYAAITQIDEIHSINNAESLVAAATTENAIGVILYAAEAVEFEEGIPSEHLMDKVVILSNITYSGHIGCGELVLLGDASIDVSEEAQYVISGSSDTGDPKHALTEDGLADWNALDQAKEGAQLKYTITADKTLQENWHVYDLEINNNVTLTIQEGSEGPNGMIVEGFLTVNGTGALTAVEHQWLEIREGAAVNGLDLYDIGGETLFGSVGHGTDTFEYRDNKWVRRDGGSPPGGGGSQYTLTLEYDRAEGEILLNGSGESPGNRDYPEGDNIEIQISPRDGYRISDVRMDGNSVGAIESYQLYNLNANHTIQVDFEPVTYTITATAGPGGSIDPSGAVSVYHGEDQAFSITPEDGYVISDVLIDGQPDGPTDFYEFINVQENRTIEARFVEAGPEQCRVYLDYNDQQGHIEINGRHEPDEFFVDMGATLDIHVGAGYGYRISSVTIGDGDPINVDNIEYNDTLTIVEDTTIAVVFISNDRTITATAGEGGSIDPSGAVTVHYGDDRVFTITPDDGYVIDAVTINGDSVVVPDLDRFEYRHEFRDVRENHEIHATFKPRGDGTTHTITLETTGEGTVESDGSSGTTFTVQDDYDITFTITPGEGYGISSLTLDGTDQTMFLISHPDGTFEYTLYGVKSNMALNIVFTEASMEDILCKSYAVLESDTETVDSTKEALAREFGYLYYAVPSGSISVSDIDKENMETLGYGTFKFTVAVDGEASDEQTGYILPEYSDIIFRNTGSYEGDPVDEIRIAHAQDEENGFITVPAMDSGAIEIFGVYGAQMQGFFSEDVRDAFGEGGYTTLGVLKPFYRVQLHIVNMEQNSDFNWYGFNVIQDDAYCVRVDARSDSGTQHTNQWDFNRYAILNSGSYTSQVFFGNDTFEVSIPESGFGAVDSISLETGDFQGYTVEEIDSGESYQVSFKSDFNDRITLDVTLNGDEVRQLTIHRVGVDIQKEVYIPDRGEVVNLFHGTQYSTRIDFSDGQHYRIYATYCIPDSGRTAPYGLYVTYTFANGAKTTRIITEPCRDPSPDRNAEEFDDGVFIYRNHAACCDYLIYSAEDSRNAPVKVNVTVLKGDPQAGDTFEGIFFGSGAGVEWTNR